jgi:hypothetical protein
MNQLIDKLQDALTCAIELEKARDAIKELRRIAVENEKRPYDPVMSQLTKLQCDQVLQVTKETRDKFNELLKQNILDAVKMIAEPVTDLTGAAVSKDGELVALIPDGDE